MYDNPAEELLALTENYRSMSDDQLLELADAFTDLTPIAQQALRGELRLRKLGDPQSPDWGQSIREPDASSQTEDEDGDDPAMEFTWKTPLCDCDSREEAWQITEVLRRAKIESWVDGPRGSAGLRILVAADQLDEARRIIALPIPADIVEESQTTEPAYEVPVCPECGTADPILEDVDPVNTWKCESCGAEWAD